MRVNNKKRNLGVILTILFGLFLIVTTTMYNLNCELEDQLDKANRTIEKLSGIQSQDQEADSLRRLLTIEQCKIKIAQSNYDIQFNLEEYQDGDKKGVIVSSYAPKLDSALKLLEAYRDKISYDSKTSTWMVTRERIASRQDTSARD